MDRVDYQPLVVQDMINIHGRGELDLNPWYQRRSVWTTQQQAFLINTIFVGKPVPSIYLRHYLDLENEKSIKEVVDGQQRIRSIIAYADNQLTAHHPKHKSKILYKDLSRTEREAFKMTSLSTGVLVGATDADVIEIFGRLNSINKTLNVQEKRNARYGGEFKQYCLAEAAARVRIWRDLSIFSATEISRMMEVQFVSELVINILYGLQDYSVKQVDQAYAEFDSDFPMQHEVGERMDRTFAQLAGMNPAAIRDTVFSRAPIFFTLFLIVESAGRVLSTSRLEEALFSIDREFNSDIPLSERQRDDADFYVACTSNMHRIKSRRIRDSYIRKHLGI